MLKELYCFIFINTKLVLVLIKHSWSQAYQVSVNHGICYLVFHWHNECLLNYQAINGIFLSGIHSQINNLFSKEKLALLVNSNKNTLSQQPVACA